MVRTAGLSFTIKVNEKIGNRIQNIKIRGKDVHPDKEYTMTAWASVQEQPGPPVYDIVINYIKRRRP